MDPVRALLLGVVAPGALALIVAVLLGGWRRAEPARFGASAAVALGGAYVLAWALVLGLPELVPVDVTQASPWFAALAALLAWPLGRLTFGPRVLASVVLGAGIGVWLTSPLVPHTFASLDAVLHAVAITATFVIFDIGLRAALPIIDPRAGAIAVVVIVTGASLAVLFANVASLAQLTGALAAGIGALVALGLWKRSAADLSSASLVIAAIVTTNLWSARLYAEGDYLGIVVLGAMPLVLLGAARWLSRPRKTWLALALPAALVVVPVAGISALAASVYFARAGAKADVQTHEAPVDGYDPDYGY